MTNITNRKMPKVQEERGQGPLWFAIAGLLVVMASRGMGDEAVGDVVALFGAAFTVLGLFYWFVRPRHGL